MAEEIKLFLEYLTVELGLAENTKAAYARDLQLFADWQKTTVSKVTRQDIISYLRYLKRSGMHLHP